MLDTNNLKLHHFQFEIIRKLSKKPKARFNELLIEELESEHMNYHLKRLIEVQLVQKTKNQYLLTDLGKNFAGIVDDEISKIEKQPKTSILLVLVRKNPKTDKTENLMSKRLKHPYYGKVGRLTGKVRFGETLLQAAKRELLEETGLKAKTWKLTDIYHKIRFNDNNICLQDTLFYIFYATDFYGQFIEKTEFQQNIWVTKEMIQNTDTTIGEEKCKEYLDFFEGVKFKELKSNFSELDFSEDVGTAKGY